MCPTQYQMLRRLLARLKKKPGQRVRLKRMLRLRAKQKKQQERPARLKRRQGQPDKLKKRHRLPAKLGKTLRQRRRLQHRYIETLIYALHFDAVMASKGFCEQRSSFAIAAVSKNHCMDELSNDVVADICFHLSLSRDGCSLFCLQVFL